MVFGSSLSHNQLKKNVKIGSPLTKHSGSVHGLFFKFLCGCLLLKATNLIVRLNKICDQVYFFRHYYWRKVSSSIFQPIGFIKTFNCFPPIKFLEIVTTMKNYNLLNTVLSSKQNQAYNIMYNQVFIQIYGELLYEITIVALVIFQRY